MSKRLKQLRTVCGNAHKCVHGDEEKVEQMCSPKGRSQRTESNGFKDTKGQGEVADVMRCWKMPKEMVSNIL